MEESPSTFDSDMAIVPKHQPRPELPTYKWKPKEATSSSHFSVDELLDLEKTLILQQRLGMMLPSLLSLPPIATAELAERLEAGYFSIIFFVRFGLSFVVNN
ncbi:hypothetical protein EV363DRAFT_1420052 [Boletus edulis]|nr:hypothetical protein EV363DRAFT_1420052 [Boletus edulis]